MSERMTKTPMRLFLVANFIFYAASLTYHELTPAWNYGTSGGLPVDT
jgi:hypothetical protein